MTPEKEVARPAGLTANSGEWTALRASVRAAAERARMVVAHSRTLQTALGEYAARETPEEHSADVAESVLRAFDAQSVVAARLIEGGTFLEVDGAINPPANFFGAAERIALGDRHPMADAVRTGRGVYCGNRGTIAGSYAALVPVMERAGAHACCAVSVEYLGQPLGALAMTFATPREFTAAERAQLRVLGGRYARALRQARLYFTERDARGDAERLQHEAERARGDAEAARAEAERARAIADEASRAKTRLLQVVSHDLRSPLQAILGYADLVETGVAGPITPQQEEYLRRLQLSGRQMLELIEDLLAAARSEASAAASASPVDDLPLEDVHVTRFTVGALCDEVGAVVAPLAAQKGLEFRCMPDPQSSRTTLETDHRKVRQALVNLAVNAVKFTSRGRVSLGTRLLPASAEGAEEARADRVEFAVADTGVGIAPEFLDRIFDAFWQVPSAEPNEAPNNSPGVPPSRGAGLGLSIARRYAVLLGGALTVESRVGGGSTFTFQIPRRFPGWAADL